jgi:predicted glycosyltransferase
MRNIPEDATTDLEGTITEQQILRDDTVQAISTGVASRITQNEQIAPRNSEPKVKAMIFVESFLGYGHFNITSLLAKELQALGVNVAITSSTFDLCGKSFDFGQSTLYRLPPLTMNADSKQSTPDGRPFINYIKGPRNAYRRLISEATKTALEDFQPSVIVYELFPFLMQWRTASTEAVNAFYQTTVQPERISLCRDIIHSTKPDLVLRQLAQDCSRIMIRGDSQFARLEESQAEWENIDLPIEYVGNFLSHEINAYQKNTAVENRLVIFGGGGYRGNKDAEFYIQTAASKPFSTTFNNASYTVITNDGVPDKVIDAMKLQDKGLEILPPMNNDRFRDIMARSKALITRGGYNTTFELVGLGKPFVVVPRAEKEQKQRAEFLKRAQMCGVIDEEKLTPTIIGKTLDEVIATEPHTTQTTFSFDGAQNMARRLLELGRQYERLKY